jgi:hypothetical protein
LPRLEPIWQKYRDKGLSIIAVERRRDRENALKQINENSLTYHFLENGEGTDEVVRSVFGVRGFPTTYIINSEGKIYYFHYGFSPGDEVKIEEEIQKLLEP